MTYRSSILISVLVAAAFIGSVDQTVQAATLIGETKKMGKGFVRSYAITGTDGKLTAVGVFFRAAALDGLPTKPNRTSRCFDLDKNGHINDHDECEGDYEFRLALPESIVASGDVPFGWAGVNWTRFSSTARTRNGH
jgi:hypothetical protein